MFKTWAGLAIDPNGILSVVDHRRIQRFYTTTGGGHTAGELKQSLPQLVVLPPGLPMQPAP